MGETIAVAFARRTGFACCNVGRHVRGREPVRFWILRFEAFIQETAQPNSLNDTDSWDTRNAQWCI